MLTDEEVDEIWARYGLTMQRGSVTPLVGTRVKEFPGCHKHPVFMNHPSAPTPPEPRANAYSSRIAIQFLLDDRDEFMGLLAAAGVDPQGTVESVRVREGDNPGPLDGADPDELVRCVMARNKNKFLVPAPPDHVWIADDAVPSFELLPRRLVERCDSAYRAWCAVSAEAVAWWREHGEPVAAVDVEDERLAEQAAEAERPGAPS